jgi:nucleoside-diphosphate-sugar epimerase
MRFDLTVNEFSRDLAINRELVVYGEQFWRPYVHVRDAAAAISMVLSSPAKNVRGKVFNVGETSENYRKLDLVSLLQERIEDAEISFVEKDEDPRDYRVSFERIKSELSFQTAWTVPRGMDEVLALLESGLIADPYAGIYRN